MFVSRAWLVLCVSKNSLHWEKSETIRNEDRKKMPSDKKETSNFQLYIWCRMDLLRFPHRFCVSCLLVFIRFRIMSLPVLTTAMNLSGCSSVCERQAYRQSNEKYCRSWIYRISNSRLVDFSECLQHSTTMTVISVDEYTQIQFTPFAKSLNLILSWIFSCFRWLYRFHAWCRKAFTHFRTRK